MLENFESNPLRIIICVILEIAWVVGYSYYTLPVPPEAVNGFCVTALLGAFVVFLVCAQFPDSDDDTVY